MKANLLEKALQQNNLSTQYSDKLLHYLELLTKWNRVFNLTRITKPYDMVYLHIIDSLIISPYLQGNRLLDVGSGAGLPGIPLAVYHPEQHFVLLDKSQKKIHFLQQAVAELNLTNVEIAHSRCEDFHPSACFDSILTRAFGSLPLFVEVSKHLLCQHGMLIAMKGKCPTEELLSLPAPFMVRKKVRLAIKGINRERHMICIARIGDDRVRQQGD